MISVGHQLKSTAPRGVERLMLAVRNGERKGGGEGI